MRDMARLYCRTEAGRKAWDTQDPRVPLEYRRILGLIAHDTDRRDLRAKLGWSDAALNEILDELEEQGMVTSVETAPDLDFTGKLFIEELRSAHKRVHEDLDFTSPLSVAELRAAQKKAG